jgi:hypothetical protein
LVLVDGWSLSFKRWLTVVGNVRLNQPGKDPAQQQLVGELVAQQAGPFVVDLVRQTVTPLFKFTRQRAVVLWILKPATLSALICYPPLLLHKKLAWTQQLTPPLQR